ncbi:KpsF/GutQ family sugar-phosphate isomerase [Sphingomonas sp. CFBP 8760]|nr:KpsF/GutQ family sugar-phosphate isomerase [Sphingomonas sp. CFBP 8760]
MFERSIPDSVTAVVAAIAAQRRPIACLGVGKSGLVAAKVAATFSSLGTPAFFLNAAEAAHGDLGAVQDGSLVLLFSNSGTTDEIIRILPILRARNCTLIGVVGRADCPLARAVSHLIPATIGGEADHIGMAPTASTTLQMAIGDGLAVAVSRARAFTREDFLRHHPAGLLGRQMVPIHAVMRTGMELPVALPSASVAELLAVMSGGRMGAACIVDHERRLVGLVVDGDIRRHLQARHDVYTTPAHALMQSEPQVIGLDARLGEAMVMMREHAGGLLVLPVTDADGRLHGMLHVNDILNG